jgi:hypothetical protein
MKSNEVSNNLATPASAGAEAAKLHRKIKRAVIKEAAVSKAGSKAAVSLQFFLWLYENTCEENPGNVAALDAAILKHIEEKRRLSEFSFGPFMTGTESVDDAVGTEE